MIPEKAKHTFCKACAGACAMEMFSASEKMSFTLGGREYSYAARIDTRRCGISCGSHTGLHKSKKWSSWSPGRFEIPAGGNDFPALFERAFALREKWPPMEGEASLVINGHGGTPSRLAQTCAICSFVCTGDKKENLENLKILRNSGCVIQYPDGSLKVLPSDEAEAEFNRFPPEHRALYC